VKVYDVIFGPLAQRDLLNLEDYITAQSGTFVTTRYIDRLTAACLSLSTFPHRGTRRDDLRPGLRVVGFERRATIVFRVYEHHVEIVRVSYGGRDYAQDLRDPSVDE
jgi:toxin ParE1/3/4